MQETNIEKDKKILTDTFVKLKTIKAISAFLDDLLTEEEVLDLAQRVKIAELIVSGRTYDEISEKIGTSTSTVSKIGQVIKYGKGGLVKVLENKKKKARGGVKK